MRKPMSSYLWAVGMQTSLLAFCALYLPRSSVLQEITFLDGEEPISEALSPLEALTRRPTLTLLALCLGTLSLQTWWSDWLRRWWIDSIIEGAEEVKRREKKFLTRKRLLALTRVYGALILVSLGVYLVLILLGAPIRSLAVKTYLLALLISILTFLPPAYLFGPPSFRGDSASLVKRWTWVRLFAELSSRNPIERALVYPAVGTVIGSWLGIIAIPLDWDRPWQAWPLTPAYGAIIGYILSSITALTANSIDLVQSQNTNTTELPDKPRQ
ncbi:hypothetical protein FA15DRAFT_584651 [Coprinopsis marcescibilis]|uniref:PIG-F-domain-containing protein n=1 Tax=Coprinopsis marcescibilis TaxID=230819 RepID=A0A5C3LI57_COPMA|nr:hypothetical protein FA15DRAFT_584651 [Coprinopsis marcescibilis]